MVSEIFVKTILNKKKQRDSWFLDDYTVNPYSGCSFNCLYCYIRGSKYGIHMEEKTSVKINAVELLEKQLRIKAKKNQQGIVVLSSATDPYLQLEEKYKLTRQILELLLKYRFPVHIITKSDLVLRDLDLLKEINEQAILPKELDGKLKYKAIITFSFSATDDATGKIFETGATPPGKRMAAMKKIIQSGFFSGVSLMPLLPYITDTEEHLEKMFRQFKDIGAKYIFPAGLTLFGNEPCDSKPLMLNAVKNHYPHLYEKYIQLFSSGYETDHVYNGHLNYRIKTLSVKFNIKTSLL